MPLLRLRQIAASGALLAVFIVVGLREDRSEGLRSLHPISRQQVGAEHWSDAALPTLDCTQFTLPNGLRVVLREDHSVPLVSLDILYHTGGRDDVPGRTGLAHLVEHMMFQSTSFYRWHGSPEGYTSADTTHYGSEMLPGHLAFTLRSEAYRMASLRDSFDAGRLESQRAVVLNERRQRYENSPVGDVQLRIRELLYPAGHPYHNAAIGSPADIRAVTLREVQDFARLHYAPNHASLTVVGDFDTATVAGLIDQYFGPIPSGSPLSTPAWPVPRLTASRRLTWHRPVTRPRLYLAWPAAPEHTPDAAALQILKGVLGYETSGRLYEALAYRRQLASSVLVTNHVEELGGVFSIAVAANAETSAAGLKTIEAVTGQELERLKAAPPSRAEVERSRNIFESGLIEYLQTVEHQSQLLNYNALLQHDAQSLPRDVEQYRRVTPQDVQRVARAYLTPRCLVLTVLPAVPAQGPGAPPAAAPAPHSSAPESSPLTLPATTFASPAAVLLTPAVGRRTAPLASEYRFRYNFPMVQHYQLTSGLPVWVVARHTIPVVAATLVVRAGAADDPPARAGLATMTCSLLSKSAGQRSALAVRDALLDVGARLSALGDWDAATLTVQATPRHFPAALAILSNCVTRPALGEADFTRWLAVRRAAFADRHDDPARLADETLDTLIYPSGHPYGHALYGDPASTSHTTLADVRAFYHRYYQPRNATLVVVGDVTAPLLLPRLEKAFAGWYDAAGPLGHEADVAAGVPPRGRPGVYLIDRPGAVQSVIALGRVGSTFPQHLPTEVLSRILAGGLGSRLEDVLREGRGYTYGVSANAEYRRRPGPWRIHTAVATPHTAEAVQDILSVLHDVRTVRPVTMEELQAEQRSLIGGFPAYVETADDVSQRLATEVTFDLPDNYYDTYLNQVRALPLNAVQRVAADLLDPARMTIVIVGDRRVIEPALRRVPGIGASLKILTE